MTPSRPYLVRAIHEWLNDNLLTPYLLVDATRPGVQVPAAFVKDGRIVLNIAPGAVRDLFIRNDDVSFSARFGGVPMQVYVPMAAVLAVYSRENGQGMFFDEDDFPEVAAPAAVEPGAAAPGAGAGAAGPALATVPARDAGGNAGGDDEPEPPRPAGGRPSLRVVK